ncbi:hypothetical protein OU415_14205 [Saccharopolyspora sp. WRP15-2]|uniref:Uncharacterized protein n=1 Tax=Saccharopolyspora oryzae TaxID=2997343 RepID=A0ABT4UZI3_9PSEU|nr:hypothetical protein [Saccharopolyspora oryzae]MDA3626596.1 hypothetical protein [Saccharopolyspora oryzae]
MTHGGPGPGYPQQQPGWQPGQQPHPPQQYPVPPGYPQQGQPPYPVQPPPPQQEPPLTLPGWGAIPAVLGVLLAVLGLFAFKWAGDAAFGDVSAAVREAARNATDLTASDRWVKVYLGQGVFIALALAAIPPALWSLGTLRSRESIKSRGGLTKKSLSEGRTGPTRIMLSAIAGLCLLYHVVTLLIMTDGGRHLGSLGPGPWLLVVGTALSVAGAAIGPRVPPRHPGWRPR